MADNSKVGGSVQVEHRIPGPVPMYSSSQTKKRTDSLQWGPSEREFGDSLSLSWVGRRFNSQREPLQRACHGNAGNIGLAILMSDGPFMHVKLSLAERL